MLKNGAIPEPKLIINIFRLLSKLLLIENYPFLRILPLLISFYVEKEERHKSYEHKPLTYLLPEILNFYSLTKRLNLKGSSYI